MVHEFLVWQVWQVGLHIIFQALVMNICIHKITWQSYPHLFVPQCCKHVCIFLLPPTGP